MKPSLLRIQLRPRSPLESLDLALRLLWEEAWPVARLSALVLVPVLVAVTAALVVVRGAPDVALAHGLLLLFTLLVCPLLQVPFTLLLGHRLFDPTYTAWGAVSATPSVWGACAVASLCGAFGLAVGVCSAGLLWLPFQVATLWLVEAATLERKGPLASLQRARDLAMEGLGHTLIAASLLGVLYVWVVLCAEFGAQSFVGFVLQLGEPLGALTSGDLTPFVLFGILVAQPIVAACRLVLWLDLRSALEGWDVEVALLATLEDA